MAAEDYTFLNRSEIAATAIGTSPRGIQAYEDLQTAAFEAGPAASAAAQASANGAQAAADGAQQAATGAQSSADAAQASANGAQTSANSAGKRADTAQSRADEAYTLAQGKVAKTVLSPPNPYSATAAATYDPVQIQALMDQLTSLTDSVRAIVAALQA